MQGAIYEVRHGMTAKVVLLVISCAAFAVLGVLVLIYEWQSPRALLSGIGLVVFCGLGGLWVLVDSLINAGTVALAVHPGGLTLGGPPRRPERIRFWPWHTVSRVVFFRMPIVRRTLVSLRSAGPPAVGLISNPPAGPVWHPAAGMLDRMDVSVLRVDPRLAPFAADLADTGLPLIGFKLDADRLRQALQHVAPHVEVLDLR